jgi:hypothetical protein
MKKMNDLPNEQLGGPLIDLEEPRLAKKARD